jgi:hypothetical protein
MSVLNPTLRDLLSLPLFWFAAGAAQASGASDKQLV